MATNEGGSHSSNGKSGDVPASTSRLNSFKLPRDLTLGGAKAPPKKVFTPNLNVVRNKNKLPLPGSSRRVEQDARGRFDRGRGRGTAPRGRGSTVIKAGGIFSEGMAARERHSGSRGGMGSGRDSQTTVIEKPVLRVKSLWKIDKELEDMHIKELMNTDYSEQQDDIVNDHLMPIRLPISEGSSMYVEPKKTHDFPKMSDAPKVKMETINIKKEPDSYDMLPPDLIDSSIAAKDIDSKDDTFSIKKVTNLLQGNKPSFILLQLPDNLPGRGSEADSLKRGKLDTSKLEINEQEQNDFCNLRQLDEGRIGKIVIHKSGKVKLQLGEIYFDLELGTQTSFKQEVVSVNLDSDINTGNMINLGYIENKLSVIPDWGQMLPDVHYK